MKKRLLFLAMSLGLSVAMLSGCGKVTTESLVDGMFNNEMESATANTTMDITADIEINGATISFAVNGEFDMLMNGLKKDAEEQVAYLDGSVAVEAMGQNEEVPFEIYTVVAEDMTTVYAYDETTDSWAYTENETEEDPIDEDTVKEIQDAMKTVLAEAELAEDTEDVEGEECYVLTLETTGEAFEDVFNVMSDALATSTDDVDMDDIKAFFPYFSINLTMYISKDSGNCVCVEVDMSETDIMGMFEESGVDPSESLGMEITNISFSACSFKTTLTDIDKTDVEVPSDVTDNAVETEEINFADMTGSMAEPEVEDPEVEDPELADPEVEDPEVEDPEYEEAITVTTNADGSATLYDYGDEMILDCYPLDGYKVDEPYSSTYNLCFCGIDDEYDYYKVSALAPYELDTYIVDGTTDMGEDYSDYNCDVMELAPVCGGTIQPYAAHETYYWSEIPYEDYYIFFQYVDSVGDEELVTVTLTEDAATWTEEEFNNAAATIFGE
ncbi:MAG TPA: hypothetical protein PLQ04_02865 [Lachnospiraceae bacterium]|nr:hypothetical protein [Lachnospiraceae bacterium]